VSSPEGAPPAAGFTSASPRSTASDCATSWAGRGAWWSCSTVCRDRPHVAPDHAVLAERHVVVVPDLRGPAASASHAPDMTEEQAMDITN